MSNGELLPDYHRVIAACFLGPKAENVDILQPLFQDVLTQHAKTREAYFPNDSVFITDDIKESEEFKETVQLLQQNVTNVNNLLNEYSVPFFSPRYMGHMSMETSLPSMVGWLSTILHNPNNVAFEASPITTEIEIIVGEQLCDLVRYNTNKDPKPWGHIAAGGTIANMESMWAARNLKFYALSLHAAITRGDKGDEPPLAFIASDFKITTPRDPNTPKLFRDLSPWQLLNLAPSVVLDIPKTLFEQYGITPEFLDSALSPYLAQTRGKDWLMKMYDVTLEPQYFVPSTKHYSWPKAAALVGIGSQNCDNVHVDVHARMDINELRKKLQACLDTQQAVYAVVAVIGSTEEGAVDPLKKILDLRDEFAKKGLSFIVHADAAWGGYFASMIPPRARSPDGGYVGTVALPKETVDELTELARADSITIDPHKSGYIPYPAGALCYRDGRMRFLLTWSAPYLQQSTDGESIGIYGIEGSKPGAPAVACYLSHKVLPLRRRPGHGALLGQVSFTSRRLSAHWAAMSDDTTDFIVVPFNPLKEERYIDTVRRILDMSNEDLMRDKEAFSVLRTLGSDLNINAFACNFRINGQANDDVEEANYLNKRVFDRLSVTQLGEKPVEIPLFLSSTVFALADYGECALNFRRRIELETESAQDLFVLRNVVMSPFQAAGNFVKELAKTFRDVLEEEVKIVVARNTITPQNLQFIMQGVDTLYLTFRPFFYNANGRHQLILGAKISDAKQQKRYKHARENYPTVALTLETAGQTTIDKILADKAFTGNISGGSTTISSVSITITGVVKNRSLKSRWRDPAYPASYTPFYLYGTHDKPNIDHMLLHAPNAQITSDLVKLDVKPALTAAQLARGVIAHVHRPEAALQPMTKTKTQSIFAPGASLSVTIFDDANDAAAHGPGLAEVQGAPIATGTLQLGEMVFVDCERPNMESFKDKETKKEQLSTEPMWKAKQRARWVKVIKEGLDRHLPRADGA